MTEAERQQRLTNVAAIAKKRREKTKCIRGHLLSGDNLRIKSDGCRACRTCNNDRSYYSYRGFCMI